MIHATTMAHFNPEDVGTSLPRNTFDTCWLILGLPGARGACIEIDVSSVEHADALIAAMQEIRATLVARGPRPDFPDMAGELDEIESVGGGQDV